MTFTITGKEDIPDGLYTATLEKVESTDEGGFDGKGYRKWFFLVDVAGVLTPFTGLSSFNTGPGSKSREWLEALMRRELRIGEQIDTPVGQKVTIEIGRNNKGYGKIMALHPVQTPEQVIPGVPR